MASVTNKMWSNGISSRKSKAEEVDQYRFEAAVEVRPIRTFLGSDDYALLEIYPKCSDREPYTIHFSKSELNETAPMLLAICDQQVTASIAKAMFHRMTDCESIRFLTEVFSERHLLKEKKNIRRPRAAGRIVRT